MTALMQAVADDGAERDRLLDRAYGLRRAGQPRQAAALVAEALRARPDDWQLWDHLGVFHRAAGDLPAALEAFRRSAALNPAGPWAATNMAFTLMRLGHGHAAWDRRARRAAWASSVTGFRFCMDF